jgi:hypothetical protein
MPRIRWGAAPLALALIVAGVGPAAAQDADKPVANLRLAVDASGVSLPLASEPPEKVYRLPAGTSSLWVAFEFQGTQPTNVSVLVLGPSGTIEFQEQRTVESPGTHVVEFKRDRGTLADNEYIINAYVGDQQYLADSLQLAVGEAVVQLGTSVPRETAPPTVSGPIPTAAGSGAGIYQPPPSDTSLLVLAAVGLAVLGALVVWAVRSAMKSSRP